MVVEHLTLVMAMLLFAKNKYHMIVILIPVFDNCAQSLVPILNSILLTIKKSVY